MDFERAKEIFYSPETFTVFYNGAPIWIEDLNPNNGTALVSRKTIIDGMITIPVENLKENH